jgi:Calcineurin-like phosphoesterase
MNITRRNFNTLGAASLGAALTPSWLPAIAAIEKPFHFAIVSDSHVIDPFYKPGSENGFEDNDSILKANDRLVVARDTINSIRFTDGSAIEQVFLPGDVFHNYPSADYDFYFQNETRIDIAKKLLDGFKVPVHMGWGNHDYDVPRVSREMSHRLFEQKLKTKPYYSVDIQGFRFLHLNNFLGSTWDNTSPNYKKDIGSLGEEQLQWAEAQLAARKPTVVFIHYPLWIVMPAEVKDFGLHPLLRKYKDTICIVISGHWHKWVDFAHTFGPQHIVTAATRYDPNAFMIFQADPKKGTVQWMDERRAEWSTHFAKPYSDKA